MNRRNASSPLELSVIKEEPSRGPTPTSVLGNLTFISGEVH